MKKQEIESGEENREDRFAYVEGGEEVMKKRRKIILKEKKLRQICLCFMEQRGRRGRSNKKRKGITRT